MAPFLAIEHVSKAFRSEATGAPVPVIDDVTVSMDEGEFVIFLGPSGCGKTTLMRMVSGLDRPSEGRVVLEDEPVRGPDRRKGMVFQSYSSFPWLSVLENVEFGMKYRSDMAPAEKQRVARHYVDLVGLRGFEDFYINRISGGMRQRVAIARTLAANPDVLLMDEPFGALDAQTREFLQIKLLEIRRTERTTVIFVTHDVDEAVFLADRIVVFSARPARIIEQVDVRREVGGEMSLETKDSEVFFQLRNRVLGLVREEAQRAERMAQAAVTEGG